MITVIDSRLISAVSYISFSCRKRKFRDKEREIRKFVIQCFGKHVRLHLLKVARSEIVGLRTSLSSDAREESPRVSVISELYRLLHEFVGD